MTNLRAYLESALGSVISSWNEKDMLIEGFIRGAIWLAIWVAAIYISKDNPLLNKIVSWPIGVWGI